MADVNCKVELELAELIMIRRALETELKWFEGTTSEFDKEKKEFQKTLRKIKDICNEPRKYRI